MNEEKAVDVLETLLRHTATDADYAYDTADGGVELVPGQDIADAIIVAIAAIREKKERRWIPVAERMPEVGESVLVYRGPDTLMNVDYMFGPGVWGADPYYDDEMSVTHWMPLPEPPKGD